MDLSNAFKQLDLKTLRQEFNRLQKEIGSSSSSESKTDRIIPHNYKIFMSKLANEIASREKVQLYNFCPEMSKRSSVVDIVSNHTKKMRKDMLNKDKEGVVSSTAQWLKKLDCQELLNVQEKLTKNLELCTEGWMVTEKRKSIESVLNVVNSEINSRKELDCKIKNIA